MGYLAAALSSNEHLRLTPVTDRPEYMGVVLGADLSDTETLLNSLRASVLKQVFPSPDRPIQAEDIERFRNRHGQALGAFRRFIERELTEIANLVDDELREKRIALLQEEADEQTTEIGRILQEEGFTSKTANFLGAGLTELTPLGKGKGIFSAIGRLLRRSRAEAPPSPMAYAAYARHQLLRG
jgi:hypothetical protein